MDETDLVRGFRAGDEHAFARLVERHRGTVYAVCRRLLVRHEDADEAAQQAFVRAWRSRDGFRGEAAFRTWVVRIALNVSRSMLASRRPAEDLDDVPEPADPVGPADGGIERDQAASEVRQAVARLPERQRTVVVLKIFSELTHREVAEIMGISEGAVKAHLHQAIANLRRRVVEPERAGDASG